MLILIIILTIVLFLGNIFIGISNTTVWKQNNEKTNN